MQRQRVAQQKEKDVEKAQLKMGTHDVTVVPGSDQTAHAEVIHSMGERTIEHFEFKVGAVQILIEDEKLYVNEKFYGKLTKGDRVLVDHERVHINGKPVEGRYEDIPENTVPPTPKRIPTVA